MIVATGGIEVYAPRENEQNIFVFQSPNFGNPNEPKFAIDFDVYVKITDNPSRHHYPELDRLNQFLSNRKGAPVKVIEGDISNSGLSAARLCAIYQTVSENHPTELIIGAAPAGNIFDVKRQTSLIVPSGDEFYAADLRHILKLGDVPYNVITSCDDRYIRRASEIMGVSRREEVDKDVAIMKEHFGKSMPAAKVEEYTKWFRELTLKKIDHVEAVSEKKRELINYSLAAK